LYRPTGHTWQTVDRPTTGSAGGFRLRYTGLPQPGPDVIANANPYLPAAHAHALRRISFFSESHHIY